MHENKFLGILEEPSNDPACEQCFKLAYELKYQEVIFNSKLRENEFKSELRISELKAQLREN